MNEKLYLIVFVSPRISWRILVTYETRILAARDRGDELCPVRKYCLLDGLTDFCLPPKTSSLRNILHEHDDRNHEILSVYELRILERCRQGHVQRLETIDLFPFDLYECLIHKISVNQENPR